MDRKSHTRMMLLKFDLLFTERWDKLRDEIIQDK
jgi:hypothetical protein